MAWRDAPRRAAGAGPRAAERPCASGNYRLEVKRRGRSTACALVAAPRTAPGPGEVEIEVRASGLNFRDVLSALGMYPGGACPSRRRVRRRHPAGIGTGVFVPSPSETA